MNSDNRQDNRTYKKSFSDLINIVGKIVIIGIFAYFIFAFFTIKNKETVNYYEVSEGELVKEHKFTGIILRKEEIFTSDKSGYIYFLLNDGKKVSKHGCVYCIDEHGELSNLISEYNYDTSSKNVSKLKKLRKALISNSTSLNDGEFYRVYDIHNDLAVSVLDYTGNSVFEKISDSLDSSSISINRFYSDKTGTVQNYIDGYESVTENDISSDQFDETKYNKKSVNSGDLVSAGDEIFKLITDEKWQIIFPLSDEDLSLYSDKSSLKINFSENDLTTLVNFRIIKSADNINLGVLDFTNYMVQFSEDRFIDFEIVTNDVSGLKIPDKSITTKDFYIIPERFLCTDGNGNKGFNKVILSNDSDTVSFVIPDIYSIEDGYCFIETGENNSLKKGDYICPSASELNDRYQIAQLRPLEGVYNLNKGYTIFKKIERLESANGYSIINKNTPYGLNVYDHIVLDASKVSEGELLYR